MIKRSTSITVLALYLLIVFGIALVGSVYGAAKELPPHSREVWLTLMLPQVLAVAAGIAFWRLLRLGAWLWFTSVLLGWVIAFTLTGVWPNLTVAAGVSLLILGFSIWTIVENWNLLRPLSQNRMKEAAE